MKAGRVITGEEHDAQAAARKILDEAKAEAEALVADARRHAAQLERDAGTLAKQLVTDARDEAERIAAHAQHAVVSAGTRHRITDAHERHTRHAGAHPAITATAAVGIDARADTHPRLATADGSVGHPPITTADATAGTVDEVVGLVVRATVPGVALGEVVKIARGDSVLAAEVVGFRGEQAVLLPLGELAGVAPASPVWRTGGPLAIRCGDDLLGRVLDGIGNPADDGPPLAGEAWAVDRAAPPALSRPVLAAPQPTGVRVIDTLLTLARGQRVGLFAAAGVGKSTLLGQIARGAAADVIVLCLVGERGRELGELLGDELAGARTRTVVVCATSDAPPLVRLRAVHVATAIAEWFRDRRGASVLLLCDSLTRVARAQREVGLSAGEPPARHGYPPSVFALLPRLVERAGATPAGAITAIYTVLVAGNDLDEPIADEVRSLVDGHIVLDRRLAQRGHFPPIDVVGSVSRLMQRVVGAGQLEAAARVRTHLAIYEEHRDLITLGAYQSGRDRTVDAAIAAYPRIERLVRQRKDEQADWDAAVAGLLTLGAI